MRAPCVCFISIIYLTLLFCLPPPPPGGTALLSCTTSHPRCPEGCIVHVTPWSIAQQHNVIILFKQVPVYSNTSSGNEQVPAAVLGPSALW